MNTFSDEESIRLAVEYRLRQWGIAYEREVSVGVGQLRADIVTADTVIEVKKTLGRSGIYQAKGD